MKKILTLFLAVAAVATAQAQTSRDEARKVILGQPKGGTTNGGGGTSTQGRDVILGGGNGNTGQYPNNYPNNGSSVDQINREYDQKIYSIRNNPNLSAAEKERIIRQLEQDRARRIRQVSQSNENRNYKKNKDYDDDDRKEKNKQKGNNGKHYGWEKGKGNPHKGRG